MLAAALLGLIYNAVILLGYGPDEGRHMNYVRLLLDEQRLPAILSREPYAEYRDAHAFHPPLYYLILLPFYALLRGLPGEIEWHVVRFITLLICLAALPLIYQIAQRASGGNVGENKVTARLVVAQIALLPMFGMTSSIINNDSATLLAVTVFLWLLVVKYPDDRSLKSALILGIVWGLGTLIKGTALLCDGVALILYLLAQDGWAALRSPRSWSRLATAVLPLLAIAGWWHLRSWNLYGEWTPLPPAMPPPLPSRDNGLLIVLLHPNFLPLFGLANFGIFNPAGAPTMNLSGINLTVPVGIWATLWAQLDWIPKALRLPLFSGLFAYCAGAAMGLVRRRMQRGAPPPTGSTPATSTAATATRIALWTSYGTFFVNWLTILQVAIFWHWGWAEGGRYLLPAFIGFSIFLARGWRGLIGIKRMPAMTVAWSIFCVALNAVAVYWLLSYLNPTFGPK